MYRSRICRVGAPVVGALGVFVWVSALASTAEAFDKPSVKPAAAAQPVEAQPSVTPRIDPAVAPTRTAMGPACGNGVPGDCTLDNGLRSFAPQEFPNAGFCWDLNDDETCDLVDEDTDEDGDCDAADCNWLGTANPLVSAGGLVDTLTVTFGTNRAGGDIYLTGDSGCNPDITNMKRMLGCAISGKATGVPVVIEFEAFMTAPGEVIWAIFVQRTGNAGTDGFGYVDGSSGRAHSIARDGVMASELGNTFHNQATTGNVGDWGDSHTLAAIGTFACVALSSTGHGTAPVYDCVANPEPTGACCGVGGEDPCANCPADANGDGFVNAADLAQLLGAWGPVAGENCLDFNGDGFINAADLAQLLGAWGPCPIGFGDETCATMRSFECGDLGGTYLGNGATCDDCEEACNPDAGSCCDDEAGTAGCKTTSCCHYVCQIWNDVGDPFCCGDEGGVWDDSCATKATDVVDGCGQIGEVCQPTNCADATEGASRECIQSDVDFVVNGSFGIVTDEFGGWTSSEYGGGGGGGNEECDFGDWFKPNQFAAAEGVFANGTFVYIKRPDPDLNQRAVLSLNENYVSTYELTIGEAALFPEVPTEGASVASDTDDDGVNDTVLSSFFTCYVPSDTFLEWELEQHIERVAPGIAVLTLLYTIENTSPVEIDFTITRQVDSDLLWITNNYEDDVVGTNWHFDGGDMSVYTQEFTRPATAVTISSPQGTAYWGAKGGDDPDGAGTCDSGFCSAGGPNAGDVCNAGTGCPGDDCNCSGGPVMNCGTDFQEWDAYGVPEGWRNYIAFEGANIDAECEQFPAGCGGACGCDGHIGIAIEDIHLEPAESTCVCIQFTMGQPSTWLGGTCPKDCGGS